MFYSESKWILTILSSFVIYLTYIMKCKKNKISKHNYLRKTNTI